MSKSFELRITVLVHHVDSESEEWLREDPIDFVNENDLFDDADVAIRET